MAKMVRCEAGLHHYNTEQHSSCPYCRKVPVTVGETRRAASDPPPSATRIVAGDVPRGGAEATKRIGPEGAEGIQPVVGWLVCIAGANRGRDYRIRAGKNSIGREPKNAIQITGDPSISREAQAFIFYDDRNTRFHFKDGEQNQNLNYVNDETVMAPVELKKGDRLQIGDTSLMFVPLCDEQFRWGEPGDAGQ